MQITSKESLFDFIRYNNAPYWKIFPVNNSSTMISEHVENDLEGAIAKLNNVLTTLNDRGRYLVIVRSREFSNKSTTGDHHVNLLLDKKDAQPSVGATPQSVADSIGNIEEEVAKRVAQRLEQESLQRKIEALEEKLLEKNNSSQLDRLIEVLKPYVPQIMRALNVVPPRVTPSIGNLEEEVEIHTTASGNSTENSQDERLQKALEIIFNVASSKGIDGVELFERIAIAVKNNPELLEDLESFI